MSETNQEPEKEEGTPGYDIKGKGMGEGIEERIPGYYKKGGIWYAIVYGPGPDIPLMTIGPGPDPDPRPIGPVYDEHGYPTNQPLINESPRPSAKELVEKLLAAANKYKMEKEGVEYLMGMAIDDVGEGDAIKNSEGELEIIVKIEKRPGSSWDKNILTQSGKVYNMMDVHGYGKRISPEQ